MYPEDLKYTPEHEWVRDPGSVPGSVRVGITDYAQEQLGDIVYVQLPDVEERVTGGEPCGELESTKSVSDVYAPVTGRVTARNDELSDAPERINADPYGDGWLIEIEPDEPAAVASLLDSDAYQAQVSS